MSVVPLPPNPPQAAENSGSAADPSAENAENAENSESTAILAAERAHLVRSRDALRRMREHTRSLSADTAADRVSRDLLEAALERRVEALADHPDTPLFFGRMDAAETTGPADSGDPENTRPENSGDAPGAPEGTLGTGRPSARPTMSPSMSPSMPPSMPPTMPPAMLPTTIHIGRRHVHDEHGHPLVLDWRAPVSKAFYQAGPGSPMGWRRRRRFGFQGGRLTAFEDEPLDTPAGGARTPAVSRILTTEIERPRTGPMRDIVATIQPEQDALVRTALDRTVCVQGAPGTGKTAVGLHRAAYLLFTHRERLSRSGVLIVGPSRAFLSYISAVLPALGEIRVERATLEDLLGAPAATENAEAAALKGDARMAEVVRRALWRQVRKPEEGLLVTRGAARYRLADHEVRETVAALRGTTRYGTGRAALAQRLSHQILVRMEQRGEAPDDRVQDAVARSRPVRQVLDQVWPRLVPEQVLFRLYHDEELLAAAGKGLLSAEERALLRPARPARSHRSARWTVADRALLDELADLIERTPSLGHLIVDEAQDLSAMQLRALGRRCATGSATVLGDLAQGTSPWAARSWDEVLAHLGKKGQVIELTSGFRVPGTVLDFAARLLPAIAPGLTAPRSLRAGAGALTVRRVTGLGDAIVAAVREALSREGSIGLIAADDAIAAHTRELMAAGVPHEVLGSVPGEVPYEVPQEVLGEMPQAPQEVPGAGSGSGRPVRVLVVPVSVVKGLEYDHVIVVEPARITGAETGGLARLYVALTRAVSTLTVLHEADLPAALAAGHGDDLTASPPDRDPHVRSGA